MKSIPNKSTKVSPLSESQNISITPFSRRALLAGAGVVLGSTLAPNVAAAATTQEEELASLAHFEDFEAYAAKHCADIPNPAHVFDQQSEISTFSRASKPYWGSSNGSKAFFDGTGSLFLNPAIKVLDVSEWQGDIDWNSVQRSDVDAVIIRAGYGVGNIDKKYVRNIEACNRLGIPYGLYLYSYAYDASFASAEARWLAELINRYGAAPQLPLFFDLEAWGSWNDEGVIRNCPSTPSSYEPIVNAFFNSLYSAGHSSLAVYSYTNYLATALNADSILSKVKWVAQYGPVLEFDVKSRSAFYGWQYTSSGSVSGISGNVDLSAFTPRTLFGFTDVTAETPHYEDIGWLKENGITTGYEDGSYRGMANVVRQDMAAFLYRLAGSPSYTPSTEDKKRFTDVSNATPHCSEVWWLGSTGISTGFEDGSFGGYSSIVRQDMAAFLYRLAGSPEYTPSDADISRFKDVSTKTPHCKEVWWLGSTGISLGFEDGTFRGLSNVVRQDMAAFLHRLYDYTGGSIQV